MKDVKAPRGYEKMDVEWNVDPTRSATQLAAMVPTGWQFYELNRENDKAVITYIRPLPKQDARAILVSVRVESDVYNDDGMEKIRREFDRRLKKLIEECIDTAPIGIGDGPIDHRNFKVTASTTLVKHA